MQNIIESEKKRREAIVNPEKNVIKAEKEAIVNLEENVIKAERKSKYPLNKFSTFISQYTPKKYAPSKNKNKPTVTQVLSNIQRLKKLKESKKILNKNKFTPDDMIKRYENSYRMYEDELARKAEEEARLKAEKEKQKAKEEIEKREREREEANRIAEEKHENIESLSNKITPTLSASSVSNISTISAPDINSQLIKVGNTEVPNTLYELLGVNHDISHTELKSILADYIKAMHSNKQLNRSFKNSRFRIIERYKKLNPNNLINNNIHNIIFNLLINGKKVLLDPELRQQYNTTLSNPSSLTTPATLSLPASALPALTYVPSEPAPPALTYVPSEPAPPVLTYVPSEPAPPVPAKPISVNYQPLKKSAFNLPTKPTITRSISNNKLKIPSSALTVPSEPSLSKPRIGLPPLNRYYIPVGRKINNPPRPPQKKQQQQPQPQEQQPQEQQPQEQQNTKAEINKLEEAKIKANPEGSNKYKKMFEKKPLSPPPKVYSGQTHHKAHEKYKKNTGVTRTSNQINAKPTLKGGKKRYAKTIKRKQK